MRFNYRKNMKDEKLHQEENKEKADEALNENQEEQEVVNQQEEKEEDELSKLQGEINEISDKYLRLVAEFDNFRKRTAKERNELIKSAGEDVIKSLLDVLDDAERAQTQMAKSDDIASLKTGMELIFNKLRNILAAKGLKKMESKGEEFNPELHDAITEVPAPSEKESGKILDEVQAGYFLNDKIIRHAKVVVGK